MGPIRKVLRMPNRHTCSVDSVGGQLEAGSAPDDKNPGPSCLAKCRLGVLDGHG